MKSQYLIRRELARVKKVLKPQENPQTIDYRGLYGAQQALCWALGHEVMAPAKAFGAVKDR